MSRPRLPARLPAPSERLCDEELADLIQAIGPESWKVGLNGSVVADDSRHGRVRAPDSSREYYGGWLVCETVTGKTAKLIAAAPDLAREVQELRRGTNTPIRRFQSVALRVAFAVAIFLGVFIVTVAFFTHRSGWHAIIAGICFGTAIAIAKGMS
jgi:hypothetical protein